jgi:glycine hydroxymethyltransferase
MIQELPLDFLDTPLSEVGPEIAEELERQHGRHLIGLGNAGAAAASEPRESLADIEAAEQLAVDRACRLFGAEHANLKPHSATQANAAVYHALLEPGETILALDRAHGGQIKPGAPEDISGCPYDVLTYHVDRNTSLVDMSEVECVAHEFRPRLILAGWSAYPRVLDFARFRAIADAVGAYLLVDMSHFAGLVAARLHPNPVPFADVVTTTIYKTLGGTRGGMILCTERIAERIGAEVHPGRAPFGHVVAGKAVSLGIAASEAYRDRQERALAGAKAIADQLLTARSGMGVLTGGTDVHLVLCDLRESVVDGIGAEARLASIGIIVSRIPMPFEPRPDTVASGLRIGTQTLACRGLQLEDFVELGAIVANALDPHGFADWRAALADRAAAIAERYPLRSAVSAPTPAGTRGVVLKFPRSAVSPAAAAAS